MTPVAWVNQSYADDIRDKTGREFWHSPVMCGKPFTDSVPVYIGDLKWHDRISHDDYPTTSGWYRVMISGDSESIDGHEIYSYPDYETWAQWIAADPAEYEDFEGGYKGSWQSLTGEENESIFAFIGPYNSEPYRKNTP